MHYDIGNEFVMLTSIVIRVKPEGRLMRLTTVVI